MAKWLLNVFNRIDENVIFLTSCTWFEGACGAPVLAPGTGKFIGIGKDTKFVSLSFTRNSN